MGALIPFAFGGCIRKALAMAKGWPVTCKITLSRKKIQAAKPTDMIAFTHPEDINCAIRKKFGSVAAFERARGLPPLSVRDILRGKSRARIARVLADELGVPVSSFSIFSASHSSHRLNDEVK